MCRTSDRLPVWEVCRAAEKHTLLTVRQITNKQTEAKSNNHHQPLVGIGQILTAEYAPTTTVHNVQPQRLQHIPGQSSRPVSRPCSRLELLHLPVFHHSPASSWRCSNISNSFKRQYQYRQWPAILRQPLRRHGQPISQQSLLRRRLCFKLGRLWQ